MTDNNNKFKTFKNMAAQGDVAFKRIAALPTKGVKKLEKFDGIVAHSETGHHHKFDSLDGVEAYQTDSAALMYVLLNKPVTLTHHRENDTHAPFLFDAGVYEFRRPVEYVSAREKARIVAD
jgi:hypothetical protein